MRSGRFLTRVARWIARVLSGMADRIDGPHSGAATGRASLDLTLAALAERFPGAPEHWLRAVAARLPPPSRTDQRQPLGQSPAHLQARTVPARFDPGLASPALHPALPPHRVRPLSTLRRSAAPRRSNARLLLPELWRRVRLPLALFARTAHRSPRPSAPLIGDETQAPASQPIRVLPIAPHSASRQRPELVFGKPPITDPAISNTAYPEPQFDPLSSLDGSQANINDAELPTVFAMPAGEPRSPAPSLTVWPTIASTDQRSASQYPDTRPTRQRPNFIPIGLERADPSNRRTHQSLYAINQWPELPLSDAFPDDAEPSPALLEALRFEQMVGRWSA